MAYNSMEQEMSERWRRENGNEAMMKFYDVFERQRGLVVEMWSFESDDFQRYAWEKLTWTALCMIRSTSQMLVSSNIR